MDSAVGPHFSGLRLHSLPNSPSSANADGTATANGFASPARARGNDMQPFVIGVTGGTASGKTTVCDMIIQQLHDHRVVLVNQDSFYRGLTEEQSEHVQDYNFDHPDAFDTDQLLECMGKLKSGQSVNIPIYDFKDHRRCSESFRKSRTPLRLTTLTTTRSTSYLTTSTEMAIIRRTARKAVGGRVPRHPLARRSPPHVTSNPAMVRSAGSAAGSLRLRLLALLRAAGFRRYRTDLVYLILVARRPGRIEWSSRLHVYHEDELIKVHRSPAWRSTQEFAEQDVTWEALTYWSHALRFRLEGTAHAFTPQRPSGTADFWSRPLEGGLDPAQAALVVEDSTGLSTRLEHCQQDLQDTRDLVLRLEQTIRRYRRITDEDPDDYASEVEDWTPDSPVRRRQSSPAQEDSSSEEPLGEEQPADEPLAGEAPAAQPPAADPPLGDESVRSSPDPMVEEDPVERE